MVNFVNRNFFFISIMKAFLYYVQVYPETYKKRDLPFWKRRGGRYFNKDISILAIKYVVHRLNLYAFVLNPVSFIFPFVSCFFFLYIYQVFNIYIMRLFALSTAITLSFPCITWATLLWPAPQSFQKGQVELNLDVCTPLFFYSFIQK